MRTLIETLDSWVDRLGGPCFLAWSCNRLPRFHAWFWQEDC